jgi:hypothetical protein
MVPDSPQAVHFLGLQRVSTLLPHFSQVKTAIALPPIDELSSKFKVQGSKSKSRSRIEKGEALTLNFKL